MEALPERLSCSISQNRTTMTGTRISANQRQEIAPVMRVGFFEVVNKWLVEQAAG